MSAPHVTGVIAQMLQKQPALTAAQIKAILIASARRPGYAPLAFDAAWGYGVVDAMAAVQLIP
jgi:subtilisin family serine protease